MYPQITGQFILLIKKQLAVVAEVLLYDKPSHRREANIVGCGLVAKKDRYVDNIPATQGSIFQQPSIGS